MENDVVMGVPQKLDRLLHGKAYSTINHMKTSILSPSNPNPYDSINHTDWDLMEIGWMLIRDSEEKT